MPENLSDTQAADVLRRAALLQAQSDHARGVGLSLDEVKRAAEAAGIDGRYVEQAYLGAGDNAAPSEPFMGIETGVKRARAVPGSVSEKEWGQMVLALRREFRGDGTQESLGNVREWKHYKTRVQLEPDGPTTRVTIASEWGGDVKGSLYGSMFYSVGAALLLAFGATGFALFTVVIALFHVAFAWSLRTRAGKRGAQLDRTMDALERLAGADEREATASPPEASGDARIDPSLLDADPLSDANASRQRLRE